MYGTRDYLAHLGYGAMRFFQDEILRGHGNFWSRKKNLPVPYSHEYCTVPKESCNLLFSEKSLVSTSGDLLVSQKSGLAESGKWRHSFALFTIIFVPRIPTSNATTSVPHNITWNTYTVFQGSQHDTTAKRSGKNCLPFGLRGQRKLYINLPCGRRAAL